MGMRRRQVFMHCFKVRGVRVGELSLRERSPLLGALISHSDLGKEHWLIVWRDEE